MNKQVPLKFKGISIIHAERMIPNGEYCYSNLNIDHSFTPPKIKTSTCMFWDKMAGYEDQQSGYCHYLKVGDMDPDGTFLLFDQVKECGINREDFM